MIDDTNALQQRIKELEAQTQQQAHELKRLQQTLQSLPSFVCLADEAGNIVYSNHPLPDSLFERTLLSLAVPEQHDELANALQKVVATGEEVNLKIQQAHTLMWFRVKILPPDEDGIIMAVGELTHEHQYEQALAQSEQRHRMITALTSDYAFSVKRRDDGTDEVNWITTTVNELLGYPAQAVRDNQFDMSELVIHDDDKERVLADADRTLQGEYTTTEYRAVAKSGDIRMLRVSRMPMWDNNKQTIIGYYAAANDITEETRAAEMRIEKGKLETALAKERELADLKSRYMSMLVHEFRTPLTIVMSNTSLIYTYWDKLTPEKRTQNYQAIVKAINYLSEMLQDLSLFIRSERGYIDYQPEKVDLVSLCRNILDDIRQTEGWQHEITFNFEPATGVQKVDPSLLKYVLVNVLSNAIKYSPVGSEITFDLRCDPDDLIFVIRDHGIGIPSADLNRIFEPFHRGENVEEVPGTGIGLAIVQEAIEAHNGTIEITSELNQGTQVTFTIPVTK